jgi:hypothetical protein
MNTNEHPPTSLTMTLENNRAKRRLHLVERAVSALLALLVAWSLCVLAVMYYHGRSFSQDEGFLALSIITRDFTSLIATPLDYNQAAPVLWLFTVKIIASVFGYSESALRAFSFATLVGVLILEWHILRHIFRCRAVTAWFCLALTVTTPKYLTYANEFKPYMSDVFFTLLVPALWQWFREKKIGALALTAAFIAVVLFSNPAAIFVAAVLMLEFAAALRHKDWRRWRTVTASGSILAAVFGVYWLLWLKPQANSDYMVWFWQYYDYGLSLRPEKFSHTLGLFRGTINFMQPPVMNLLLALSALAGGTLMLWKKQRIAAVSVLFLTLLLTASVLGKYPLTIRLWLFLYALMLMYAAVLADAVLFSNKIKTSQTVTGLLAGLVLMLGVNLPVVTRCIRADYGFNSSTYSDTGTNHLIAHVLAHLTSDESIYTYDRATTPTLRYKIGRHTRRLGGAAQDNIIFGGLEADDVIIPDTHANIRAAIGKDIQKIKDAQKCWVLVISGQALASGDINLAMRQLIGSLQKSMFIDEVLRLGTRGGQLYYCYENWRDSKLRAELRLVSVSADGDGKLVLALELKNTGEAILLNSGPDALAVTARFLKNGQPLTVTPLAELPDIIRPNDPPLTVTGTLAPPPDFDTVEIDITGQKGHSLSELGMKKIIIPAAQLP